MRRFATWIAVGAALLGVAFAAGFFLASSWGNELLRREVESLLGELMEGEVEIDEVRLVLSHGIGLAGRGIRVYPSDRGHALQAETAYIELNEPALALGEFELALLVVEDAVLQLSLGEDGLWSFPPLRSALDEDTTAVSDSAPTTPVLEVLAGAESVARFLLEDVHIADRIVVHRGAVHFEDHSATADARPGTRLQRFHLQHIEGILSRPWLSDRGQLGLSATFFDPDGNESPVRCTSFVREGAVEIALAAMDVELKSVSAYVQRLSHKADARGRISGEVRLEAAQPGYQHVLADLALADVRPTVVVGDEPAEIEVPMEILRGRIEVEPTVARLVGARLSGSRASLAFEASVERPIDWAARARVSAELGQLSVQDLLPIIDLIPDGGALLDWFSRIESGTVDRFSISGRTTFSMWGRLLDGDLTELPEGFLIGAEVSNVTARLEGDERVVDGSFRADWAADRLEMRHGHATWRGEPLPEINVTVDGLSSFVGMEATARETDAQPVPGIPLLWDFLSSGEGDPEPYRFHVDFDYVDHPILRWPVEDARVTVQPIPGGTESVVTRARWGDLPVIAEVIYLFEPEPVVTVGVQARRGGSKPDRGPVAHAAERIPGGGWGRGRFRLEPGEQEADGVPRPLSRMSGSFKLSKASVRLSDVEVTVSSNTHVAADLAVDLADEDVLPVAFQGRLDEADIDDIGPAIGLPAGFVTGRLEAEANITGHLERGKSVYAGLRGVIRATARDGKIRQKVPLAVKMATATDGFNPFAKSDKLRYETIDMEVDLEDGQLTANRFELEGPVRVYATGTFDFARPPQELDAVIGVFLFQRMRELLGMVPLVNLIVPGTDKGMVGAYFSVRGPWEDPEVEAMPLKSLKEELPGIIKSPVEFIQSLWKGTRKPAKLGAR